MREEIENNGEEDRPFPYEREYVLKVIKEMLERQKPGIDKVAASLYWDLREVMKALPDLRDKLQEMSQEPERQHQIEFDAGRDHWQFIANKDDRVGDFRLIRGDNEEEAMILIGKDTDNRFAYWNKSFAIPSDAKIFRGPNDPAARKIREMISKLSPT